jgi:single-stranded DNA-binding protein
MRFEIPGTGKSLVTPIFVIPSYAAGDSCAPGAFEEGATLLISGRLYPHKEDHKMYVVPVQPLQVVNANNSLNHVHLAGGVGFIGEQRNPEVFNFGLMCQAPKQKTINHDWQDSLGFRIEAWNDDGKRMEKFLFVGRQISLGGALKFECWTGKDGDKRTNYKIRVKSSQYSFFGKNKKEIDVTKGAPPEVFESPHQQAMAKPAVDIKDPVDDGIPF